MSDRIIFLDIDGVLNSREFLEFDRETLRFGQRIDPQAMDRLNRIIEEAHAKVVVSSSWRAGRSVDSLQELLDAHGFGGEVVDKLPEPDRDVARETFIVRFLMGYRPHIDSFVVLEDIEPFTTIPDRRIVRTGFADGLQQRHVEVAVGWLKTSSDELLNEMATRNETGDFDG